MGKAKTLSLIVLFVFVTGCAQMSYRQKTALKGAALCSIVGAGAGGIIAHNSNNHDISEGQGIPIGAVTGALICGSLAYLFTKEPKPPPAKPAPPPRVEAPPPPPPPPPPRIEVPPPVRTIVLDDVLFDFDKTAIKPNGRRILDRLVNFLNENRNKRVELEGHTDWIGTEKYNQGLSERRAASVRNYLIEKGVSSNRISARGFGEASPIADNRTREGRAKNRRVEVKVR